MSAPWVVIGCGYTGTRLASTLVGLGANVTITRRDHEVAVELAASLGARGVRADLAEPSSLAGLIPPEAIIVCLAPPGGDPAGEVRALIAGATRAQRLVYVSSTGVYPAGAGAWVDETWPVAPITPSGAARVAAEAAVAESPIPWITLRAAGIHGPGRGLVDRIRSGTYRIVGDGRAHVSRIHVVDLVDAIIRAGTVDATGAVNIADDDPAPIGEVADAIAATLGLAPPPRVAVHTVTAELAGMLTADRRIENTRMKRELGVVLKYPSWRDATRPSDADA